MDDKELAGILSDLMLKDGRFTASYIRGNQLFIQYNDLEEEGPVSKWVGIQIRTGESLEEMEKPPEGGCNCPRRSGQPAAGK
ncbi:hypothetical protein H1S01_00840 [Heliobacterium chlorum]|uniref:Uncharacterized protein n=1 Tax=Heliobacterium chlorum TaxID=2698 RepID=A0ABR7SWX5_HELCL|nr:hypothetical protein [Heliobacterium chlorum]MBC9783050.1 hypothetical protein [Heliobacterium chlorum]